LPSRIGYTHTVIVIITDSNGQPINDAQVKLSTDMQIMHMGGTSAVALSKRDPVYVVTFGKNATFDMAGAWQIQLEIQRPGQALLKKTFIVTLTA
jgi:hypothetical protein